MSPSNSKLKSQLLLKAIYSIHKILDFLELKKEGEGEEGILDIIAIIFRYHNFYCTMSPLRYTSFTGFEKCWFYLAFMECLIFVNS